MKEPAIDPRYLEVFPQWLRSLGDDARAVADTVAASAKDDASTRCLISGLNYIFKSLDLIPDGIDDLGFLDDAFVLRVASAQAAGEGAAAADGKRGIVDRLTEDYGRLETYVAALRKGAARGRTVEEIATDSGIREQFLQEVRAWSGSYQVPSFTRDQKTLVKLKSFLNAKLP